MMRVLAALILSLCAAWSALAMFPDPGPGLPPSAAPFVSAAFDYYVSPTGSDAADGLTESTPWATFAHAQAQLALDTSGGKSVGLMPGDYGEDFVWANPPAFTSPVTIASTDPSDRAILDRVYVHSTGTLLAANLVFDSLRIRTPAGTARNAYDGAFETNKISDITLKNSEAWNEDLYSVQAAVFLPASERVRIINNHLHDARFGVRKSGQNIVIHGNTITRIAASAIGDLSGSYNGGDWASRASLVTANHIYDLEPDYPTEAYYSFFDDPGELHGTVLGARGQEVKFIGNYLHDIGLVHGGDQVSGQIYDGDSGVTKYTNSDIEYAHNVTHSVANRKTLQFSAGASGPVNHDHNTLGVGFIALEIGKAGNDGYDGTGTTQNNNISFEGYNPTHNTGESPGSFTLPSLVADPGNGSWTGENWEALSNFYDSGSGNHTGPQLGDASNKPNSTYSIFAQSPAMTQDYIQGYDGAVGACEPYATNASCDLRLNSSYNPGTAIDPCKAGTGGGYVGAISCTKAEPIVRCVCDTEACTAPATALCSAVVWDFDSAPDAIAWVADCDGDGTYGEAGEPSVPDGRDHGVFECALPTSGSKTIGVQITDGATVETATTALTVSP